MVNQPENDNQSVQVWGVFPVGISFAHMLLGELKCMKTKEPQLPYPSETSIFPEKRAD